MNSFNERPLVFNNLIFNTIRCSYYSPIVNHQCYHNYSFNESATNNNCKLLNEHLISINYNNSSSFCQLQNSNNVFFDFLASYNKCNDIDYKIKVANGVAKTVDHIFASVNKQIDNNYNFTYNQKEFNKALVSLYKQFVS